MHAEILFKIQLGVYAEDEYDNQLNKIFSLPNFDDEQIDELGTTRYTSGKFYSLDSALKHQNNFF